MKKSLYLLLALVCFSFCMPGSANSGGNQLNQLIRELEKGGIPQADLKAVNKELENLLGKGGKQEDIGRIILHMSKHGVSGDGLTNIIRLWSEVINAGGNHKNTNDLFSKSFDHAKNKGLKGNDLAALIQDALQQSGRGTHGGGSNAALNDLLGILAQNGVTQNDLRGIDKQLGNLLNRGGNKQMMQALLLEMVHNGVTGSYLMDTVNAWNNQVNAGADHKKTHDIIAGVLNDSKAKGLRDKDLAAAIEAALRQKR
jgi:hypothetical protein